MKNLKTLGRRAAAVTCAALLATSLMAPAAFADPAASESSGLAAAYKGTTYRVTVYSGNQGTFADGETQVVFEDQKPGDTFSFEGITLEVPESSKYYAKGVRLAALDNVRSDKNRDGKNIAGTETHLYANVAADGKLVGSAPITEDTDFVVAYGILANRVAYTVTYTDTEGNQLAEPQTFFGDIGDVPATAPAYIEGYVPDAALLTKTLVADESQNVFPFVYTKLASGQTTEQDPNTGDVTINTPNGPTGPIYNPNTGLPTITFPNLGGTDQGGTTTTTTGGATGAGTGAGAGTTAPAAAADAGAAATGAAVPLVTADGTEVVDENGNPLAEPREESLDDNETPQAAGAAQQPGDVAPALNTDWIPWAIAAAVIAAIMVAIIIVNVRKKKEEAETLLGPGSCSPCRPSAAAPPNRQRKAALRRAPVRR